MHPLVSLVKRAVETFIRERKIIFLPEYISKEFLNKKAGTFVTIKQNGNLRGCIGTYLPIRKNIAEEIIYNAIAAATEDYRFGPIREEELPHLSYTVYILGEPELVKDVKELDPKKYGIIVKTMPISQPNGTDVVFNGHSVPKSGLLLPDLEGVDTIEEQISIACRKGSIDPSPLTKGERVDPTQEKILIYRFRVEKFQ